MRTISFKDVARFLAQATVWMVGPFAELRDDQLGWGGQEVEGGLWAIESSVWL